MKFIEIIKFLIGVAVGVVMCWLFIAHTDPFVFNEKAYFAGYQKGINEPFDCPKEYYYNEGFSDCMETKKRRG